MIMLIFEDGEETVIQNILLMVGTKVRVYEAGFKDRCTLAFPGLVIDELQHGLFTQKWFGMWGIDLVGLNMQNASLILFASPYIMGKSIY